MQARTPAPVAEAVGALARQFLAEPPAGSDTDIYVRLGPYLAQLNLVGSELAGWVPPHFAQLIDRRGVPDLVIRARLAPRPLLRLETTLRQFISTTPHTSFSLRWDNVRVHLEFDEHGLAAFETIDVEARRAVHVGASLDRVRDIDGIRPFLVLLRWWSETTPYLILHAAAVGHAQAGVLIGGTPGAGKSSTALASAGGRLQLVGDDMVLIGADGLAHALHATLRLRPDMISRFGSDAWFGSSWSDWREKPSQIVPQEARQHLARCVRPGAIILPRLGGGPDPVFRRIPVATAMRAMTPITISRLYTDPGLQLQKLTSVLGSLPCYEFNVVPDLGAIRGAFEQFVEELANDR